MTDQMTRTERVARAIEPCPFCGAAGRIARLVSPAGKLFWGECAGEEKCVGLNASYTEEEALVVWNTRALSAIDEERDALREALDECAELLACYRSETPLGHQPHMIALKADEAIALARSLSSVSGEEN